GAEAGNAVERDELQEAAVLRKRRAVEPVDDPGNLEPRALERALHEVREVRRRDAGAPEDVGHGALDPDAQLAVAAEHIPEVETRSRHRNVELRQAQAGIEERDLLARIEQRGRDEPASPETQRLAELRFGQTGAAQL